MSEDKGKDIVEISFVPDEEEENGSEKKQEKAHKKRTTVKELRNKLLKQEEIIQKIVEERNEYRDKYLRGLAEVDNFRKRVKKEKEEYQKYVLSEFLLGLLQIFDNLERALKAKTDDNSEKSIISGVSMIYKQFIDFLKKYNVVEIEALNKPFDPNYHQALSKEEREEIKEPIVIEVYQKGFIYNDKLLRPALVKVAIPKEEVKDTMIEKD